jgi:hypothetical protein
MSQNSNLDPGLAIIRVNLTGLQVPETAGVYLDIKLDPEAKNRFLLLS